MRSRYIHFLVALMIVPRFVLALTELTDSELKTVRGQEGIDFNRVFKKKNEVQIQSPLGQNHQQNVSFDQAFEKPKPTASNQTIGFDEAFSGMPDPEQIAESASAISETGGAIGATGGLLAASTVLKGMKVKTKLDMEMNMSLDDVFTSITGIEGDLKGMGFHGNIHTKIQGNVMIEFR